MESKENRVIYFDYLRIISVFAVIVLHISGQNWNGTDVSSFEWNVFNAFDSLTRWCVPVFVMISGALFLDKEQPLKKLFKKNILRITVALIVWSVLYTLWDCFIMQNSNTIYDIIAEILLGYYHLWFLYMLLGLYLIIPFLKKIVEKENLSIYFVALAFLFAFLIPQCFEIIGIKFDGLANILKKVIEQTNLNFVLGYSGYFVLGYLLKNCQIKKKTEVLIYIFGACGAVFTIISTAFLSNLWQSPTGMFYGNLTVNVLLMSVAMFVFAKKHLNKLPKSKKREDRLAFFSKCSFGVYLIHVIFIQGLSKILNITSLSFNPVISIPLLSVIVFLLSMIISAILNKLPFIKKWLV